MHHTFGFVGFEIELSLGGLIALWHCCTIATDSLTSSGNQTGWVVGARVISAMTQEFGDSTYCLMTV